MEWKIGEIKQVNGEWYQCIENWLGCEECDFKTTSKCIHEEVKCSFPVRQDHTSVIFKKLEKVGDPTLINGKRMQLIKALEPNTSCYNCCFYHERRCLIPKVQHESNAFYVEIKQKENMEEKNNGNTPLNVLTDKYVNGDICYDDFEKEVKALYSCKEEIKPRLLSLKEFDLEAAKAGKPICTRDGRRARIICFDRDNKDNMPIVALIYQKDNQESICIYYEDGRQVPFGKNKNDLMMFPEKKSGWVNVDKRSNGDVIISKPYLTRDEAIHNSTELTIDTVKIKLEE